MASSFVSPHFGSHRQNCMDAALGIAKKFSSQTLCQYAEQLILRERQNMACALHNTVYVKHRYAQARRSDGVVHLAVVATDDVKKLSEFTSASVGVSPGRYDACFHKESESTSSGVRLLLRARDFHVAVRGFKDPSGSRYIATLPKRHAHLHAAEEVRRWELESEGRPPDGVRFWKLTEHGSIDAITLPETVFQWHPERALFHWTHDRHSRSRSAEEAHTFEEETATYTSAVPRRISEGRQQVHRGRGRDKSRCTSERKPSITPARRSRSPSVAPIASTALSVEGRSSEGVLHEQCSPDSDRFGRFAHTKNRQRAERTKVQRDDMLVPFGWGWAGEFRLGSGREGQELWPRHLHPSLKARGIVDIATGKRHTLFVSNDGLVFSVGEGLGWQLGTTSRFTNSTTPRVVQRLPKQVHPSGELKVGKDFWIVQAAAGNTFSITREATGEDAANAVEGFQFMKAAVNMLLTQAPSSSTLQELREHMMEEERSLHRRFEGRLLSWGTGTRGQLGLGEHVDQERTPRIIRALSGKAIRTIAAGTAHALCITLAGKLYSWGRGRDGRLGHGDYNDRWEPCLVEALRARSVALAAAGTAHSAALVAPRSVYTWGRGAHGRLGIGDNRCRHEPARLKSWPPSFLGCSVKDVALGGAHTVVLAHRGVPVTLANPWGIESAVFAWGFGSCGQLGLGKQALSPASVRDSCTEAFRNHADGMTSRKELITGVAAGKAYTLAINIQGQLFSWGKGWTGQLGLGKGKDMRVAPVRVDFPGAGRNLLTKVTAGEQHASALAIAQPHPPSGWDKDKTWRQTTQCHVGMKKWESTLLTKWRCPRRPPWRGAGPNPEPLFACATCDLSSVCRTCARTCHKSHKIQPSRRNNKELGGGSLLLAPFPLDFREKSAGAIPAMCRLLMTVADEDAQDAAANLHQYAVACQRVIRGWSGRRKALRRRNDRKVLRREAIEAVWYIGVLGAMQRSIARFDKDKERERNCEDMTAADVESAFYRYYRKLQPAVQALNLQMQALRDISTAEGVSFDTSAPGSNPRASNVSAQCGSVTLWSRRAARQFQRILPPSLRLGEKRLVLLTAALPAADRRPRRGREWNGEAAAGWLGGVPDPDVETLLQSSRPMRERSSVDIAGPEGLYKRVTRTRAGQLRRLFSRRRASFTEEDGTARVDKARTTEDKTWAHKLGRYWTGVDISLGATTYLQISQRKCDKLTDPRLLHWRRGARALHNFLRGYGPGSVDPDVAAVKYRAKRGRTHSLCAPERLYAATVTWKTRHAKTQALLRAAAKNGLPASGDCILWTSRANAWGGLVPPPRRSTISMASLRRSGQRIVQRAAKRGWDLRPGTGQSSAPSGGIANEGDNSHDHLGVGATSLECWSSYEDDDGNLYYVNNVTGESQWEIPVAVGRGARGEDDDLTGAGADIDGTAASEEQNNVAKRWYDGDANVDGTHQQSAGDPSGEFDWSGSMGDEAGDQLWSSGSIAGMGGEQEAVGWKQEWDASSESYYWYDSRTGESCWA